MGNFAHPGSLQGSTVFRVTRWAIGAKVPGHVHSLLQRGGITDAEDDRLSHRNLDRISNAMKFNGVLILLYQFTLAILVSKGITSGHEWTGLPELREENQLTNFN